MRTYYKRTKEFEELITRYYPEESNENTIIEEVLVGQIIIFKLRGKYSGALWEYSYLDGEIIGIKLIDKEGKILSNVGLDLMNYIKVKNNV